MEDDIRDMSPGLLQKGGRRQRKRMNLTVSHHFLFKFVSREKKIEAGFRLVLVVAHSCYRVNVARRSLVEKAMLDTCYCGLGFFRD